MFLFLALAACGEPADSGQPTTTTTGTTTTGTTTSGTSTTTTSTTTTGTTTTTTTGTTTTGPRCDNVFEGTASWPADVTLPDPLIVSLGHLPWPGSKPNADGVLLNVPLTGGAFSVALPDGSGLPPTDLEDLEGVMGALYVPVIIDDLNTNGTFESNEPPISISRTHMVVYTESQKSGWPCEHWNVVDTTVDPPQAYSMDHAPELLVRGVRRNTTLAGAGPSGGGSLGLVGVPVDGGQPAVTAPSFTTRLTDPWSVDVTLTPALSVLVPISGTFISTTYAYPFVFLDADGDAAVDAGETITLETACYGTDPVFAFYVTPPTNMPGAWELEVQGWYAGWQVATGLPVLSPPEALVLADTDRVSLDAGNGNCALF